MIVSQILTIGIDNYRYLGADHKLRASESASAFGSLFSSIHGGLSGKVQRHYNSPNAKTDRADIIERVMTFSKNSEAGTCNIIYVACHGQQLEDGFVFCATDYRPNLPADTGLSLRRLQEIITRSAIARNRCVIIADVCRTGGQLTAHDSVFPGVTLIWTAAENKQALEVGGQTAFLDCIASALRSASRRKEGADNVVCLREVIQLADKHRFRTPLGAGLRLETSGDALDSIYLPVATEAEEHKNFVRSLTLWTDSNTLSANGRIMRDIKAAVDYLEEAKDFSCEKGTARQQAAPADHFFRFTRTNPTAAFERLLAIMLLRCPMCFNKCVLEVIPTLIPTEIARMAEIYNLDRIEIETGKFFLTKKVDGRIVRILVRLEQDFAQLVINIVTQNEALLPLEFSDLPYEIVGILA